MIKSATIIFPHQLLQNYPAVQKSRVIYLVEDWLFYPQYNFHRKKLVLQRASMKFSESWLCDDGYTVHYTDMNQGDNYCRELVRSLATMYDDRM